MTRSYRHRQARPALIAVLINREHSRLSSQVKTLERVLLRLVLLVQ